MNHISVQLSIFCILRNSFSDALSYDRNIEVFFMMPLGHQTCVAV